MDYEKLREDLIDYFGTAMENGNFMAVIDLLIIEVAPEERLEQIAIKNGFNLEDYKNKKYML